MKKFYLFYIIIFLFRCAYPQETVQSHDYPFSKEVWSEPKVAAEYMLADSNNWGSLNLSHDGKTLYSGHNKIVLTDTGWSEKKRLNSNIPVPYNRFCCPRPDNKMLVFDALGEEGYGLYYALWDSTTNDWGEMNSGILGHTAAIDACWLNDSTLIYGRTTKLSIWSEEKQEFGPARAFPGGWGISHDGFHVLPDSSKIYYSDIWMDTLSNGKRYINQNLFVMYPDTNSLSGFLRHQLNFSKETLNMYEKGNFIHSEEYFPTLTPDGKKMYFLAKYHTEYHWIVYETHLIVDENGDSVLTTVEDRKLVEKVKDDESIQLKIFPNPTNSSTTIRVSISTPSKTDIDIYNIQGELVKSIESNYLTTGEHYYHWNGVNEHGSNVPSGIYFIRCETNSSVQTQKLIMLK